VGSETKAILSLISQSNISTLVEVGIGGGAISSKLLNSVSPEILLGIDTSIHMLHTAKKKLKSERTSDSRTGVSLIRASIYNLPLKESTVDGIIAIRLISHLSRKELVFKELHDALKSNGFVIFDYYNRRSVMALSKLLTGNYGDSTDILSLRNELESGELCIKRVKSIFTLGHVIFDRVPRKILSSVFLVDSLLSKIPIFNSFSARRFVFSKKKEKYAYA
jgi:ubiquinone/menaquinone biosynthesis C-methylase UbiE